VLPQTIAVDMTPVLPGGENGGAKHFAIELVRRLAARAPRVRFVVLTQSASHAELERLDAPNVERRCVVGPAASAFRRRIFAAASPVAALLRGAPRRFMARLGYRLHVRTKRRRPGLLRDAGVGLLYCPFTAPTYREPGIATVCTVYDLQYRAYPRFFSIEDATQREMAFAEACREATALAAISDYTRRCAIENGCEAAKVRTIALRLASPAAPEVDGSAVASRTGVVPGRFLLYPANFWPHKNHEVLLEAFTIAAAGGLAADMRLVCTGSPGPRRDAVMRRAASLGIGERVSFPGYLAHGELIALMARCAGVVFPSLYEGFGIAIVEAMACAVPVACSDAAALPEVAGDAALRFDPASPRAIADAILALAGDEALRARLVEAGRRRAEPFRDADRMADEYLAMFESAYERAAAAR
jgi:glycosyltransferase involved in cell wall biosynthesis